MSSELFWRTVISGIIATFIMAMVAFLQGGIGLPVIDVGHILKESFNHVHESNPYSIVWGNLAYFIVGILLALMWVAFFQKNTPGNWLVQGILFGFAISVIAGLIVAPIASRAAGEPFGIFYTETWVPGLIALAGIMMHVAYGVTLSLCLRVAGIKKDD